MIPTPEMLRAALKRQRSQDMECFPAPPTLDERVRGFDNEVRRRVFAELGADTVKFCSCARPFCDCQDYDETVFDDSPQLWGACESPSRWSPPTVRRVRYATYHHYQELAARYHKRLISDWFSWEI